MPSLLPLFPTFSVTGRSRLGAVLALLAFIGAQCAWSGSTWAGDPEPLRLSLVRATVIRVDRQNDATLAVVETSVGRLFVPTSDTVPTKAPDRVIRLAAPARLESLLLTAVGGQAVLLLSQDAPGLIVGCLPEHGDAYVAPLASVRK